MTDTETKPKTKKPKGVKCVVWDLDHTVWNGILLEDERVELRPGVLELIRALDERGILQSVASRNDRERAMARLEALGIADYFLHPQIDWSAKGQNVERIAQKLNIGLDTFLFIDDQPFEREEVAFACPAVRTLDAADLSGLLERPELNPEFITDDSRQRRRMYQADIERQQAEEGFAGPSEEFLRTLQMRFTLGPCGEDDLQRAEELTVRTNQLNTTGYTYGYDELDELRRSPRHQLLISSLEDRHGSYGKIGLTLIEMGEEVWTVKLLLMSCRVMSKGVGTIMIHHVLRMAKEAGVKLRAEFVSNDRNRQMLITYRFAGFKEVERQGEVAIMENDFSAIQPPPPYVDLRILG